MVSEAQRAAAELEWRRRCRARWFNDPALYAREHLGLELWGRQVEILEAVATCPAVAVRSGHKIGKSLTAEVIAHWWADTRPEGWVVQTSASGRQVKAILWEEFVKLYRRQSFPSGPTPATDPGTGYRSSIGARVQGFATNEPERMAGFSGADLLFILDEASGIPEAIFEAIEGNRAGGARVVMFSNPTRTSGTFYDAFHSKRQFWKTIHVSSEESPNVIEGRTVIRGLAERFWVEEKRASWGVTSPLYQVRVAGNFPQQGSDAVVFLHLVEEGQERWRTAGEEEGELEFGVDPARFGDDESVIAPKRGDRIGELRGSYGLDGVQLAGRVLEAIRELRRPSDGLPAVKVDGTGVGASCCDQLRQFHNKELRLFEVHAASNATDPDYHRMRDQLWFSIRDFLSEGGQLPPDDLLARDLLAPVYFFDSQGRRQVESKEDTKKRLGRSPDRADAVALAICRQVAVKLPRPAIRLPKRRM